MEDSNEDVGYVEVKVEIHEEEEEEGMPQEPATVMEKKPKPPAKYQPYSCPTCHRTFYKKSNMLAHEKRVHFGLRPCVCETCGKRFAKNNDLTVHQNNVHKGIKPYLCKTCNRFFGTKRNLSNHINTVHIDTRVEIQCSLCGKFLIDDYSLKKHCRRMHKDQCDT